MKNLPSKGRGQGQLTRLRILRPAQNLRYVTLLFQDSYKGGKALRDAAAAAKQTPREPIMAVWIRGTNSWCASSLLN